MPDGAAPGPGEDAPADVAGALAAGVALTSGQRLTLVRHADGDVVQFSNPGGGVTLSVCLTERGPVLRFEGASLLLQVAGDLALEADHLRLHGRRGVSLTTDEDLTLAAAGDLRSTARAQHITASLGDVAVAANDDVKLVGERIRMNC